ncbi:MAG: DUF805 domain-containing protein [Pseudomonadota bacterium]
MMGPAEAIGHCLSRYTGFAGRAGQAEFWWFAGFVLLFAVLFSQLETMLGFEALFGMPAAAQPQPGFEPLFVWEAPGPVVTVWMAAMALPFLAVGARRLQDRGMERTWLVLWVVPIAGWLVLAAILSLGGDEVENEYGMPPEGTVPGE